MPGDTFLPNSDTELSQWLANFNTVASANLAALRLTATELATVQSGTQAFVANTADAVAARNAAVHATQTKTASRAQIVSVARTFARRIQGTTGVSDTLKQQLGLTVPSSARRTIPVFAPQNLQARIQPTAQILLTWEPGGNEPGTIYWVERKCGQAGAWTAVDSVTATRLTDSGCTPGMQTFYRLCAKRGTRVSPMSAEAVVY